MAEATYWMLSLNSLAEELQDTGRELISHKGLGGGKVGTLTIPSPGSCLIKKAASGRATEHLHPPKEHLLKTMDKVHKGTGFSRSLSGTKLSTGC